MSPVELEQAYYDETDPVSATVIDGKTEKRNPGRFNREVWMSVESKIRLRSEEELQLQFEGLLKVSEIVQNHLDSWFVSSGTLLGAVRDGDFIPWDWDVCIDVLTEEAQGKLGNICVDLESAGFRISKLDQSFEDLKVVASGFGTDYEILGRYLKRGQIRARLMTELPAMFYETAEWVSIRGTSFPAPSPAEDFLAALYDDWRTPKRTADKAEYLSAGAYVNRAAKKPRNMVFRLRAFGRRAASKLTSRNKKGI